VGLKRIYSLIIAEAACRMLPLNLKPNTFIYVLSSSIF